MFMLKNLAIGWLISRFMGGSRGRSRGGFGFGRSRGGFGFGRSRGGFGFGHGASGGLLSKLLGSLFGGRRRFG